MYVRRALAAACLATALIVGATAAPAPTAAVTVTTGQTYVALGDSITAGAIPWYDPNTPNGYLWAVGEWINSGFSSWAHLCGRAINNPWPARVLTEITSSGTPQRVNASCSGATTAHVTGSQTADTGINGVQAINGPQRNYITAATKVVTITLGGNDAELLRLIGQCVGAADCTDDAGPWDSILGTGAGTVQTKLDTAYDAVEAVLPAGAKVVVVRYSAWVPDESLRAGSGDDCQAAYGIDADETAHVATITKDLNQAIVTAAAGRTGWSTVDLYGPSQTAPGHDFCAGATNKWVTGPTAGETASVAWTYNGSGQVYPMHLNDAGHAAYADVVGDAVLAA